MMTYWPRWIWPPGLAAGNGWWWEKLPSSDELKLTSVESAGQRHWGDPAMTDLMKPEGDIQPSLLHLVMPRRRASSDGSGGFKPWWFYWTRDWVDLAYFHNSFLWDFIWFMLSKIYLYLYINPKFSSLFNFKWLSYMVIDSQIWFISTYYGVN